MYHSKKELTFLYNKNKELDRKALAMAHTLGIKINRQELTTVRISESLFVLFLEKLNQDPKCIIDKSNPYYQKKLRGKEFNMQEWFQIIKRMPCLLKAPLAMYNDSVTICQSPNDLLRLG